MSFSAVSAGSDPLITGSQHSANAIPLPQGQLFIDTSPSCYVCSALGYCGDIVSLYLSNIFSITPATVMRTNAATPAIKPDIREMGRQWVNGSASFSCIQRNFILVNWFYHKKPFFLITIEYLLLYC